MRTNPFGKDN